MTKDEYIKKYGEEEGLRLYRHYARTLENFIFIYGKEEGIKRYNNWKNNVKNSNAKHTAEQKREIIKKALLSKKGKKYKNLKRDLSFYIQKYGEEEGKLKYNAIVEHNREFGKNIPNISAKMKYRNSKQYYIDTYGKDWETKYKQWCKSQDHGSLNFFIKKYGEEEGKLKYYLINSKKHMRSYYLKISKECFDEISIFIQNKQDIFYGDNEFKLYYTKDNIKKCYSYDFKYNKKLIEFQGDAWHCNPKFYIESQTNPRGLLAKDIWFYDNIKKEYAIKNGYEIMYIWESEWKKNKLETISKVLQFLNN